MENKPRLIDSWVPSIEELQNCLLRIVNNIGGTIMHEEEIVSDDLKMAKMHFENGVSSIVDHIRKQERESVNDAAIHSEVGIPTSE